MSVIKTQEHRVDCLCYYCYLGSLEWIREKKKAFKAYGKTYCIICHERATQWHHYKGYEAIWTKDDWKYIVFVCDKCHKRCHFRLRDDKKIVLEKRALYRRYLWVKRTHRIGSTRPSDIINFFIRAYSV